MNTVAVGVGGQGEATVCRRRRCRYFRWNEGSPREYSGGLSLPFTIDHAGIEAGKYLDQPSPWRSIKRLTP